MDQAIIGASTGIESLKKNGRIPFLEDKDEETVNVFETDWYRDIKSKMTPGDNLKIYRENRGLTQVQLGEILGA